MNRNVTAIRTRLNATFGVVRATVVGSHKKGTAIRTYSDVDVFVVLQRMEARWGSSDVSSTTLLKRIRDDLQARYPATAVRRDEVAVVVGFGSGEFAVDVVPALFDSFRGRPIFRIPDGGGGWMPTAPDAQLKWLRAAHAASARRLIPVVRMLKWWSCTRAATASFRSTYLEALLGCENVVGGPWSHAEALARAFSYLARSGLSQVADPAGISSDSLAPTRTPRQRATLLEAARSAAGRSTAALAAERAGDWRGAIRQWSIIFNYQFPE